MKRSKVTKVIAASLMGMLLVTGCGGGAAKDNSADAEPLKVGLLRIDDSFPFYVAEQEGLFEKHNVAVELQGFSNARDQTAKVRKIQTASAGAGAEVIRREGADAH